MTSLSPVIYPLIVAAGVGKRFGTAVPKQYTQIRGETVLQHSVKAISHLVGLAACYVVISAEDNIAQSLNFAVPVTFVVGGMERMHSVFHGVKAIWQGCPKPDNTWVMIHDAARPCVKPCDIQRLIQQSTTHSAGGILAVPVRDTVKQSQPNNGINYSKATIDRNTLWLAQTPQIFPLEKLYHYLKQAIEQAIPFTDEASLFEYFGEYPLLIEGSHSNIKLTFPEDLVFAEVFLANYP